MTKVLEVRNLGYQTPDNRPLIQGLGFELRLGELLTIKGSNGIGKSTLLKLLLNGREKFQGSIQWSMALNRVGFLSQLHNQEFHISLILADILNFGGKLRAADIEQQSFGLLNTSQLRIAWNTASGGERQKTLLTRIFLQEPQVLILDEPMNHLDKASRKQLRLALQQFVADGQHAVVMVGHESNLDPAEWNPHTIIDLKGYVAP